MSLLMTCLLLIQLAVAKIEALIVSQCCFFWQWSFLVLFKSDAEIIVK